MSGKAGSNNSKSSSGGNQAPAPAAPPPREPTIVTGHQYHMYSQGSGGDRYAYIGKNEDREPEFLDYGPKSGR
jgi:hypothetical protein